MLSDEYIGGNLSYIYKRRLVCLCVCGLCNTNGRPNGLPDLDQNLGMDSHSPSG